MYDESHLSVWTKWINYNCISFDSLTLQELCLSCLFLTSCIHFNCLFQTHAHTPALVLLALVTVAIASGNSQIGFFPATFKTAMYNITCSTFLLCGASSEKSVSPKWQLFCCRATLQNREHLSHSSGLITKCSNWREYFAFSKQISISWKKVHV